MRERDGEEPLLGHPLALRAWRDSEPEKQFIAEWRDVLEGERELGHVAGLFHANSFLGLTRVTRYYRLLKDSPIIPGTTLLPLDDSQAQSIQSHFWALLQSAKGVLDSLAREVDVIYWQLDHQGRFFDPISKARWISFYAVRQKLLRYDDTRHDPVSRLIENRTTGETAVSAYRALSHLANVSLLVPLVLGPVVSSTEPGAQLLTVRQCQVWLADDPRELGLRDRRKFEINETSDQIREWLDVFPDEVYASLVPIIERREPS